MFRYFVLSFFVFFSLSLQGVEAYDPYIFMFPFIHLFIILYLRKYYLLLSSFLIILKGRRGIGSAHLLPTELFHHNLQQVIHHGSH